MILLLKLDADAIGIDRMILRVLASGSIHLQSFHAYPSTIQHPYASMVIYIISPSPWVASLLTQGYIGLCNFEKKVIDNYKKLILNL